MCAKHFGIQCNWLNFANPLSLQKWQVHPCIWFPRQQLKITTSKRNVNIIVFYNRFYSYGYKILTIYCTWMSGYVVKPHRGYHCVLWNIRDHYRHTCIYTKYAHQWSTEACWFIYISNVLKWNSQFIKTYIYITYMEVNCRKAKPCFCGCHTFHN